MTGPATSFRAVPRSKVYTAIVEQVIENIRAGTFPPGSALPSERVLAERLGVSRASLREAIRVLEHAHIVDVRGGSGTYVTAESLSKATTLRAQAALAGEHSPLDLVVARAAVEPRCAELAATSRHARDLAELRRCLHEHAATIRRGDDPAEIDSAFHLAVAAASHNGVLSELERYFVGLMHQPMWDDLKRRTRLRDHAGEGFLAQHRAVYRAIRERDPVAAGRRMRAHLDAIHQALLQEVSPADGAAAVTPPGRTAPGSPPTGTGRRRPAT